MGRVLMLNPFGLFENDLPHLKSHGINPLAALDPSSDRFVDEASAHAEALVKIDNDHQPYFPKAARNLVAALAMWVRRTKGPAGSYLDVRRLLTAPTSFDPKTREPTGGFLKTLLDMATCDYYPIAAKVGQVVERFADQNASSGGARDVMASAAEATKFLDSPPIARDMQGPGFDFTDMRREIITVYLILPTTELVTHDIWFRLVVNCALRALYQPAPLNEPHKLPPVLFVLDEFAALGKLDAIETALGIAGGSRIQLWPFLQDANQLKDLYPNRWQSFMSNAGALTAFAPKDWFTASELAKLPGQKTEIVETENFNSDGSGGGGRRPEGFPVIRPEDLMRMPPGQMFCFVEPEPFPFFTMTRPYPETPFNDGLDPNPYFRRRRWF